MNGFIGTLLTGIVAFAFIMVCIAYPMVFVVALALTALLMGLTIK